MAAAKTSVKSAPAAKSAAGKPKAIRGAEQRYHQARRASILLKHVSDPTRLQVILILSEGERHVGALCAQLSQSQPAVSHHLALLAARRHHRPAPPGQEQFLQPDRHRHRPRTRRQESDLLIISDRRLSVTRGHAEKPLIRPAGHQRTSEVVWTARWGSPDHLLLATGLVTA